MEENYLVRHSAQAPSQKVGIGRILGSRRVVGRAFFAATFVVAAAVFVGALAVFAFVPRLGAGFVLGARAQTNLIGLADEVALGRYGTAGGARHTVVLRATLPRLRRCRARRPAATPPTGSTSVAPSTTPTIAAAGAGAGAPSCARCSTRRAAARSSASSARPPATDTLAGADRQEIEAVGIPAAVLFAADRPVAIELPSTRLGAGGTVGVVPRWSGEAALRVAGRRRAATASSPSRTRTTSPTRARAPSGWRRSTRTRGSTTWRSPTAWRDCASSGRGSAPAADGSGKSDSEKIAAVVEWLRSGHSYTTRPPPRPAGVDPVDDFLFSQPVGHCEFFASAAVLLLRAAGVPARYVTGFRGGEWNPIGGYVAVRGERAHAWAEAFVAGAGWTRVDATPPADALAPAGRLADTSDALDFFWSRWVVGYDLGRQRDLGAARLAPAGPLRPVGPRALLGRLLIALGLGAALAALALAMRKVQRRRAAGSPASRRPARRGTAAGAAAPPSTASTGGRSGGSRDSAGPGARTRRRTSTPPGCGPPDRSRGTTPSTASPPTTPPLASAASSRPMRLSPCSGGRSAMFFRPRSKTSPSP